MGRGIRERLQALLDKPPATVEEWGRLVSEEIDRLESTINYPPETGDRYLHDEETVTVSIVSDGTRAGTKILDSDGKKIKNVSRLDFKIDECGVSACVLKVVHVPISLERVEAQIVHE